MEESIKHIWAKGFLNSEELKAPKINDLYTRKSALTIGKIKKAYTLDVLLGEISVTIFVITLAFLGYYTTAISISTIYTLMHFYYKSILKPLETINIETNSYEYLTTYKNKFGLVNKKRRFFMTIYFPFIWILLMYIFYNESGLYEKIIKSIFGTLNNYSIFIFSYLTISITMLIIAYLSEKVMYNNSLKKIDEIIADMEVLRA